jgi:hypothetical protein
MHNKEQAAISDFMGIYAPLNRQGTRPGEKHDVIMQARRIIHTVSFYHKLSYRKG